MRCTMQKVMFFVCNNTIWAVQCEYQGNLQTKIQIIEYVHESDLNKVKFQPNSLNLNL